jgi:hypothetical protein
MKQTNSQIDFSLTEAFYPTAEDIQKHVQEKNLNIQNWDSLKQLNIMEQLEKSSTTSIENQIQLLLNLISVTVNPEVAAEIQQQIPDIKTKLCSLGMESTKNLKNEQIVSRATLAIQCILNIYMENAVSTLMKIEQFESDRLLKVISSAINFESDVQIQTFGCYILRTFIPVFESTSTTFSKKLLNNNIIKTLVSLCSKDLSDNELKSALRCLACLSWYHPDESLEAGSHTLALKWVNPDSEPSSVREQALAVLSSIAQRVDESTKKRVGGSIAYKLIIFLRNHSNESLEELDTIFQCLGSLFVFESVFKTYQKYSQELMNVVLTVMHRFAPDTQKKTLYEKQALLVRHCSVLLTQFCYDKDRCSEALKSGLLMTMIRLMRIAPTTIHSSLLVVICQMFMQHGIQAIGEIEKEENKDEFEHFCSSIEEIVKVKNQ